MQGVLNEAFSLLLVGAQISPRFVLAQEIVQLSFVCLILSPSHRTKESKEKVFPSLWHSAQNYDFFSPKFTFLF